MNLKFTLSKKSRALPARDFCFLRICSVKCGSLLKDKFMRPPIITVSTLQMGHTKVLFCQSHNPQQYQEPF